MSVIDKYIEIFNEGTDEEHYMVLRVFNNDLLTFIKYIDKKGRLGDLDFGSISYKYLTNQVSDYLFESDYFGDKNYNNMPDEFRNHFLLYGLENNYEDTMVFITNGLITDVKIRPDGFYLHLRDREELEILFCSGRRGEGARYVAKMVLSEDGLGHDWYYDNSVHPHQVVDELDDSNITELKDIIFKEIGDKELSLEDYDSDFFSELSEEQGTEGYFRIRAEDLNGLVNDEDAFNELCKNDLDELGSNLRSLYWQSENSAYEDELYELVYKGLDEYFEGRIDDVPREVTKTDGSKITRYDSYIKIRDFQNLIETFLEKNKGSYYSDSHLEYFGGLISLMVGMYNDNDIDCIDFRVPDYPDWNRTRRNINELFNDFI
jgi:hypothetical protein